MKTLFGIGASDHVAVEQIFFLERLDLSVQELNGCDFEVESKRYLDAKAKAFQELGVLYEKTKLQNVETAKVFEIHQMMIEDLDFVEGVEALLQRGKNAEYAVKATGDKFFELFNSMDDEVLKARSADVVDITNRLIRILKNLHEDIVPPPGKFILISEDLFPSEIVKFDHHQISGFVTKSGSKTSHAAILARTLNLPIVVNLQKRFEEIPHFGIMAINGATGEIVVNPNPFILQVYKKKLDEELLLNQGLEQYRGKKAITKDHHTVTVAANIGSLSDVDLVLQSDADAVGLFRSEFIYLESLDYPTEEFQYNIYKTVLERLSPRNVVIRTMDIGADKTAGYFKLQKEENPALGFRAIRICLEDQELFKTQLRALYRASVYGNLSIMFPMITHKEQVLQIKTIIETVKAELNEKHQPFSTEVEVGIMIETPASVMISDELAPLVDFFSIGTNDLTQYTLAVDRMNSQIEALFDSRHESVKRMIAMTAKAAHANDIWVGICGESASDPLLLDFYMENKIDELSVSPGKVLGLKKAIIEH
jgi:phosphoenolpyruvate-protein phosphotransferase (PTS system enzyme I)